MTSANRLDRRRVYVLPTRHGAMLGAMLLVILLGAINYDNALAYLLAFLLAGLFVTAMLHTYRNLAGLELRGGHADPVFAGGTAEFRLMFAAAPGGGHRALLLAHELPTVRSRWRRRAERSAPTPVPLLDAASGAVTVRVPAARRGRLALGRLRVASVFPLGILRAWGYLAAPLSCLVFPTPAGAAPLPIPPLGAGAGEGGGGAGTDDFTGLREYRAGESLRGIHWRAAARTDELLVKRFAGGAPAEIRLRWQDLPGLGGEARLSQLARWVLEADALALRYGLELPGARLDPGMGAAHRERALGMLALFELP